jgi:hypothetical protein
VQHEALEAIKMALEHIQFNIQFGEMSDHSSQETHAIVQAGVGIFFQQDVGGFVVVKTIVKGGSAERDGTVQIGDRILSVDDRSVAGESLPVLRSLILGPQGSVVKMKFARLGSNGATHDFSVSLIRGTSEYFSEKDSLSRQQRSLLPPVKQSQVVLGSSGNQQSAYQQVTTSDPRQSTSRSGPIVRDDDDVDALRLRLRQIASAAATHKEESERIKRILLTERNETALKEKEKEEAALAHEAERFRLQEALRKADIARRELDSQTIPLEQRVQDMKEEYARGSEKEHLRQEYIDELRGRFEEEIRLLEQQLISQQNARRDDLIARHQAESMLAKVVTEIQKWQQIDQERSAFYFPDLYFQTFRHLSLSLIRVQREIEFRDRYARDQVFINLFFIPIRDNLSGALKRHWQGRRSPSCKFQRAEHQHELMESGVLRRTQVCCQPLFCGLLRVKPLQLPATSAARSE